MSIHFYSILRTNIPDLKTSFVNKLFLFFTATMVWSSLGPYHGLWLDDAPTKPICIIPTPWRMTRVLGLGVRLLSPSSTKHTSQQFWVICHNIDIAAVNINITVTLDYTTSP
jgi:hypothetical protein